MYEPIRGGTRGGQAEFKWSDVSADKDREHYLGHSINAPTGRWQKNKDVHWYNRELKQTESEKQAEIRKIKEAEAEAMAQVLGFAPTKKTLDASGSGDTKEDGSMTGPSGDAPPGEGDVALREKLERRRRKVEKRARKEEKKARKEAKRAERRRDDSDSEYERRARYGERRSSRSRSPRRRDSRDRNGPYRSKRSRSMSHVRRRSVSPPPRREVHEPREYDIAEQERERERDRRRWDTNTARDLPRGHRPH